MAACLQTELQLTKTLPQATTELVNSRMIGKPDIRTWAAKEALVRDGDYSSM
jgi:hypothetical protein